MRIAGLCVHSATIGLKRSTRALLALYSRSTRALLAFYSRSTRARMLACEQVVLVCGS